MNELFLQLPASFYLFFALFVVSSSISLFHRPAGRGNWCPEHARKAEIKISDDGEVAIENLVHAEYRDRLRAKVEYRTWRFKLYEIESVELFFEYFPVALPFGRSIKPTHVFLSFTLKDGRVFSLSIAARRMKGQGVGLGHSMPHGKEIIYKIIKEEDTLLARAYFEKDELYAYRLKMTQEQIQSLFRDIAKKANKLAHKPEWFDAFFKNCTSECMKHLRRAGLCVPYFHPSYILTAKLEEFLAERGVLCINGNWQSEREKHQVNDFVEKHKNDSNFSAQLREELNL